MPANKYALLRYRIIDRCLTNKGKLYPSKEDLRQECEDVLYGSDGINISTSTIEKDMWAMRNESELGYYAPIEYHKGHKGYYYAEEDYSIRDVHLNDEDLDAIHFAVNTLFQFKDIAIFDQFGHAIDKIVDRLSISPNANDSSIPQYVQFENTPLAKGSDHLAPLLECIKERKSIDLGYQKFNSEELSYYTLEPYLLKEYRGRWYLIAKDQEKGAIRTFGLERMVEFSENGAHFELNKSFSPDRFFKHSIGITELASEPENVILECTDVLAHYLRSQPIHPSQKEVTSNTFTVHVLVTYELINLILGFGAQIKVIDPKSLQDMVVKQLKDNLSHY